MTNRMIPSTMQVPPFLGQGRIDFVEKPVPEPGPGQLLIRVQADALCGSELGQLVHPDVQSVLIAGAGPVGLGVLAMARILLGETTPVLIADIVPYRLELAQRLGGEPIDLQEQTIAVER